MIVDNVQIADGSYRIESIEDARTINIGQMSLYERLADRDDFDAGVLYNVEPGEPFVIPQTGAWRRK